MDILDISHATFQQQFFGAKNSPALQGLEWATTENFFFEKMLIFYFHFANNCSAIVRRKNLIVLYFSNNCQLSDNLTVRLFAFSNPGLTNKLGVPLYQQKGHSL